MKRTGAGILVIAAAAGLAVGFLLNQALTAAGRPTFSPALSLPILLVLVGLVVLALAIPIGRATRGRADGRVNPFRALRIAMLAKASSLVGAVFGGVGVGLVIFLLSRPVTPSLGSMATVLATVAGGIVLVAAALIAEHLCTIRKDDDDQQPGGDDPGLGAPHH